MQKLEKNDETREKNLDKVIDIDVKDPKTEPSSENAERETLYEKIRKMNAEELFKFYDLSEEQIALFHKLRKEEKSLCDLRLIMVVCAKKIYSKCIKACKNYREVLDHFKVDTNLINNNNYKKDFYFLQLIKRATVWAADEKTDREGFHYCQLDYQNWKIVETTKELNGTTAAIIFLLEQYLIGNKNNMKEGVVILMDCNTFRLSYIDWKIEGLFSKLISKMPIRIKKMIMYDMPWYFKFLMAIMKPFLSKKMRQRFLVIKKKKLLDYIDEDNLRKKDGGKFNFNYREWVIKMFKIDIDKIDLKVVKQKELSKEEEIKQFKSKTGLLKEIMDNYKEAEDEIF